MTLWSIPRLWRGEPAFILGGGPSLRSIDARALHRHGRILAINLAFRADPWADCLYINDEKFITRFRDEVADTYRGGLIVTQSHADPGGMRDKVRKIKATTKWPLSRHREMLAGWDSGTRSINLAYLFGANPIVLIGFDMRPGAWHDGYSVPSEAETYAKYARYHEEMAPWLAREGVTVWNCSEGSALRCYPFRDILAVTEELDWRRPLGTPSRKTS